MKNNNIKKLGGVKLGFLFFLLYIWPDFSKKVWISFSQTQRITDNYQNQVIGFDNSFPYDFHYNIIQNSLSANPLIYYPSAVSWDPKPDPVDALGTRNVKCNCFPSNPVFYPTGGYIWQPTWCPPANCTFDEPGQEEFEMAVAAMDTGDYNAAETQFKSIIQDFPVNKYARESAKKLLPVTVLANHDLLALKNYYCTATNLHLDSVTSRLTERLMTRCDVERKDYQPAIAWYEEAILNPYSTNDSIYSIIDLEDTYMLASVDSNLKMAATGLSGQLMQYKPKSKQEYISNKDRLIRLLFKEGMDTDTSTTVLPKSIAGKCMLYQNSPNPFSEETTVSFYLPVKSDVILVVTNFLANPIKTVSMPGMESGLHSKTINFQDNPDGVYVISLNVNGNENSRIKCIKNY